MFNRKLKDRLCVLQAANNHLAGQVSEIKMKIDEESQEKQFEAWHKDNPWYQYGPEDGNKEMTAFADDMASRPMFVYLPYAEKLRDVTKLVKDVFSDRFKGNTERHDIFLQDEIEAIKNYLGIDTVVVEGEPPYLEAVEWGGRMKRRTFLRRAGLIGAAAFVAPKVLFATPVSELRPLRVLGGKPFNGRLRFYPIAAHDFLIGDFVVMSDGEIRHPQTWNEPIIGVARENIKKGQTISYDPEGKVGNIITENSVFNVSEDCFNKDMVCMNRLTIRDKGNEPLRLVLKKKVPDLHNRYEVIIEGNKATIG